MYPQSHGLKVLKGYGNFETLLTNGTINLGFQNFQYHFQHKPTKVKKQNS